MIFLFFVSCFPKPDTCVAPPSFGARVENMTLKLVHMIVRHGERTPQVSLLNLSASDNWNCDSEESVAGYLEASPVTHYRSFRNVLDKRYTVFKPNCRPGDLTVNGMNQHLNLGQNARKHFVDDLMFLPKMMDPNYFYFLSSPFDRCFKSAQSFLVGLYPPLSDNEVLSIETGTDALSSLYPNPSTCKELNDQKSEFYKSENATKYLDETWPKMEEMNAQLHLSKSHASLLSMCDWAVTYKCAQDKIPKFITPEVFETCQKAVGFYHFDLFETNPSVPISHTLRHIFQVTDEIIGQSKPTKFVLVSAHDSTITALLVFLGYHNDRVAPFASNICMELYSDNDGELYIRFVFNGVPVLIKEFNSEFVRYDTFRSWANPQLMHCLDIPI